jgi:hypothetical protein
MVETPGSFAALRMTAEAYNRESNSVVAGGVSVFPPIVKCAMDGAPVDWFSWKENRQRQEQKQSEVEGRSTSHPSQSARWMGFRVPGAIACAPYRRRSR